MSHKRDARLICDKLVVFLHHICAKSISETTSVPESYLTYRNTVPHFVIIQTDIHNKKIIFYCFAMCYRNCINGR